MRFVEQSGAQFQQQMRAVEMEIEQQKREWEEKRLAQQQQEDLERMKVEKEDNIMLTYSREDALNKVNIKTSSSTKSNRKYNNSNSAAAVTKNDIINNTKIKNKIIESSSNSSSSNSSTIATNITRKRIKSENVNQTKSSISLRGGNTNINSSNNNNKYNSNSSNSNGTSPQQQAIGRNGIMKKLTPPVKRNLRNVLNKTNEISTPPLLPTTRRALSRKSDRSNNSSIISKKTNVRSISESTRSSISRQTSSILGDDSDSECSLDVMIDSNDVNDSDSNSNHASSKVNESNFDSTSQDDDTLMNDDHSTITDETTIDRSKNDKATSSPRTRSRGTVKINLWSLDESPILPPKRQKTTSQSQNIQMKSEFGVKECKVSVVDIQTKNSKPSPSTQHSRIRKRLMNSAKNNYTLDSWIQKVPEAVSVNKKVANIDRDESPQPATTRTTRRNANKTL